MGTRELGSPAEGTQGSPRAARHHPACARSHVEECEEKPGLSVKDEERRKSPRRESGRGWCGKLRVKRPGQRYGQQHQRLQGE